MAFLPTRRSTWPGFFVAATPGAPRVRATSAAAARSRLVAFALMGVASAGVSACTDATTSPLPVGSADGGEPDAGEADGAKVDSGSPSRSECPASQKVTPDILGFGYLPPQTVTLVRDIDGDTAHFAFPTRGELDVRFLYVNTEESKTADTTQFGIDTGKVVDGYLKAATSIVVAIQADNKNPTQPNLDPYGRTLGLVFVDGDLFQTRLVREGWTAYYTSFGCATDPTHTALLYAEAEAHAEHRGIWAPDHPTDYAPILAKWIHDGCRPNPFNAPYCK